MCVPSYSLYIGRPGDNQREEQSSETASLVNLWTMSRSLSVYREGARLHV